MLLLLFKMSTWDMLLLTQRFGSQRSHFPITNKTKFLQAILEEMETRYWREPSENVGSNVGLHNPGFELFSRIKAARATKNDKALMISLEQLFSDIQSSCRKLRKEQAAELEAPSDPAYINRVTTPDSFISSNPSSKNSKETVNVLNGTERILSNCFVPIPTLSLQDAPPLSQPFDTTGTPPLAQPFDTTGTPPLAQPFDTTGTPPLAQPFDTTGTPPLAQPFDTTGTPPFAQPSNTTGTPPLPQPFNTTGTPPLSQSFNTTGNSRTDTPIETERPKPDDAVPSPRPSIQEDLPESQTLETGQSIARYTSMLYEDAARSGKQLEYRKQWVSLSKWRCVAVYNGIQGVGEARSWKLARHIASQDICETFGITV
jgi:hypothetical protein